MSFINAFSTLYGLDLTSLNSTKPLLALDDFSNSFICTLLAVLLSVKMVTYSKELSKLNPYVKINIMEGNDIINHIKITNKEQNLKYDVIVITEFLPKKFIMMNYVDKMK